MASYLRPRPLIIQDENLDLHHKSSAFDGNVKSTKAAAKKDGGGLGSRKALNDITNKAPLKSEASTRKRNVTKEQFKKNIPKEEFKVAEEGFLHDHTKCIEEQMSEMNIASFLDLVLPCHDSVSTADHLKVNQVKAVKHKEAEAMAEYLTEKVCWKYVPHDNSDSPPISPEHSVRWSDHDDWSDNSDSPPLSPEHSVRWRWSDDDWIDFDHWRMGFHRDWIDIDYELKSP